MPEYVLMALCLFILAVTGVLRAPCAAVGLGGIKVCYLLLCAAVLSPFEIALSVEVTLNAGAVAMVFLPALVMAGGEKGSGGVMAAVVLFAITIALLCRTGAIYGADNGVLCGLLAGCSAILLPDCPQDAVFAACAIPVASKVVDSFLQMTSVGYASFELGVETITAQLLALFIAVGIVWLCSLAFEDAQTQ